MFAESRPTPRLIVWVALLFVALAFTVSWWHWWTFQYGTFDLAFYVQALWLALRGVAGSLPFQPDDDTPDPWAKSLAAEAKRFRKR